MDQEMAKSLVNLIDETISEIEDLKKSRYSAAEAKIGDNDSGMAGKDKDGSIEKEEAEKADGKNEEADPGTRGVTEAELCADPGKSNLHSEAAKADDEDADDDDEEDKKKKKKDDDMDKAEGKNAEADPGKHGDGKAKLADSEKSNLEEEAKKAEEAKKSAEEQTTLMKSYVDEQFSKFEGKFPQFWMLLRRWAISLLHRKVSQLVNLFLFRNLKAKLRPFRSPQHLINY